MLAADADGNSAVGVSVLASLYNPQNSLVGEFEGETGGDGWLVVSFELGEEGLYRVVVQAQDVGLGLGAGEATVLVCSTCPRDGQTATTTETLTTTATNYSTSTTTATATITYITSETTTQVREKTIVSGVTSRITLIVTVTGTMGERSVTETITQVVTVFSERTLTAVGGLVTTTATVGGIGDGLLLSGLAAVAISLLLLSAVVYGVMVAGGRR
ncbi:MAG: hypothetical protein QXD32_05850 [Nitrososphaerota archaeon]